MLRLTRAHSRGDLQLLAFQYLGVGESYGGPLGPTACLGGREVDDEAEGDDDDHVDGGPGGVSRADECGGDQLGGATEGGDHQLMRESNAGYPDGGRKQLGLNGRVNRLPDTEDHPSGGRNQDVYAESRLVQQQQQGVEEHDHADGTDDGEDLASSQSVGKRAADRHDDDQQGEPDDTPGQ